MRLVDHFILHLASLFLIGGVHLSVADPNTVTTTDVGDSEYSENTTPTPSSSDFDSSFTFCKTTNGDSGRCTTFSDCYPLARIHLKDTDLFGDDDEASILSPLEEEIMKTSHSNFCLNETTKICCKIFKDEEESIKSDLSESEESSTIQPQPAFSDSSFNNLKSKPISPFPKDCGRSSLLTWRRSMSTVTAKWVTKGQKITGGRTARQGQFPWMVAIFGKNGKITCGATLITNSFVLTAAHCLATYTPTDLQQLKLHVGDYNIMSLKDGPHEVRRISQVFVHKRFNSKTYHNDIALIKISRPVSFTERIQAICLPKEDTNVKELEGKAVLAAGWGRDRPWGYDSSILRVVEFPMWKYEECRRIYNIFAPNRINETMNLCAGDGKKNKDACIGDSGGPLMGEMLTKGSVSPLVQLGIISWGKGCGSFPGVYSNVATFIPWIEKQIRSSQDGVTAS